MRMIGRYAPVATVLLRREKNKLAGVSLISRYVVCCVGAEFFCQMQYGPNEGEKRH